MKLLILGGGSGQLSAIKKAKEMGHRVIVSDYYADVPGKKIADCSEMVSTFDIEGNIEVARKHDVDGIMTAGTDQPVYTAAAVAAELDLPSHLSPETARAVTNKREMKNNFRRLDIPTVNFKILPCDFSLEELDELTFPVVTKPLDSQGQRGVFRLTSPREVKAKMAEVLKFSREEEILVEEYYDSSEITVSGWVCKGQPYILTVTDRVTFERSPHIGICAAHIYPSSFLEDYHSEIEKITREIVAGFKIVEGPIYFQMLVGADGIRVNEIACRIGGAYEGDFMPRLVGVDILEMMVALSLGYEVGCEKLQNYGKFPAEKWLSVQLFFAEPGQVCSRSSTAEITGLPGVFQADFNFEPGDEIGLIENATERAGYFIVEAASRGELKQRISQAYDRLEICDESGHNLVLREAGEVL
ncbi:MAG: ATP-grasp domain-containing protein [Halanaerobiaceae bacterium]